MPCVALSSKSSHITPFGINLSLLHRIRNFQRFNCYLPCNSINYVNFHHREVEYQLKSWASMSGGKYDDTADHSTHMVVWYLDYYTCIYLQYHIKNIIIIVIKTLIYFIIIIIFLSNRLKRLLIF